MSAEVASLGEDFSHPDAWGERTVAVVSVSPWYRVPRGVRVRTVNLTIGNQVLWKEIRKESADSWPEARRRTEETVRRMLTELTENVHHLAL